MRTRTLRRVLVLLILGCARAGPARGAGPTRPIDLRLPADLSFDPGPDGPGVVVFRHGPHVAWAGGKCTRCHPEPFRILDPEGKTSHAAMDAGRSCGACHDGRRAWGTADSEACARCHEAGGKPPKDGGEKLLLRPLAIERAPGSPGRVIFRHSTHLGEGIECGVCHPSPFAPKETRTRYSKAELLEGGACGSCHRAECEGSFAMDDPEHCGRCHEGPGGRTP